MFARTLGVLMPESIYKNAHSPLLALVLLTLTVCRFYGIPLYLIREIYTTFRQLRQRVKKFVHYRRIIANMDVRCVCVWSVCVRVCWC